MTALLFLGAIGLIAASAVWSGYVLSILWAWFAVPAFAAPALSIPAAIGVALIVGFMTHQHQPEKKSGAKPDGAAAGVAVAGHVFLRPAFALAMGWVVKQWM